MSNDPIPVSHDSSAHRFVAKLGGQEAYLAYRRQDDTLDFYYTYVPDSFRGRGIAEALCKAGFEYAKANQLKVIPSCPYVGDTYLRRHPEYRELI